MKKHSLGIIKLGADPEVFIFDKVLNRVISAEGLIGGTKEAPKKISKVGHAIQEDNVMAEFNIPPALDAESFSRDIQLVLDYLNENVVPEGCEVLVKPSAVLDEMYLMSEQALRFGCDPDLNVWEREANSSPNSDTNLRTCGGHIHVGYNDIRTQTSEDIIKAMDLFLGVPSILMDTDTERRKMYGKAGACRFKNYGVEYRTLSNFWIKTDELRKWAFNNTILAIQAVENGVHFESYKTKIVTCINTQDKELAKELISLFNIPIVEPVKEVVNEKVI